MKTSLDRFFKVRPLIEHVNEVMSVKQYSGEYMSVDDKLVPYYGWQTVYTCEIRI